MCLQENFVVTTKYFGWINQTVQHKSLVDSTKPFCYFYRNQQIWLGQPNFCLAYQTFFPSMDGKFYPTRLIAQTLPLLTTVCSGRCRTPSLEYGSHQNRVSKIGLIHSWPPNRRSSFGMESTNCQKVGKKS